MLQRTPRRSAHRDRTLAHGALTFRAATPQDDCVALLGRRVAWSCLESLYPHRLWVTARLLVALLLAGAGYQGTALAGTAPVTIAPLHGNTAVEAYGGVEAWSDYEAADRSWHVCGSPRRADLNASIPSASKAIEVAVGPGPSGSPVLAYLICARRCHLVVSALNGSDPRAVPGTEGASDPTIWGDRVAWVSGAATVMTSL